MFLIKLDAHLKTLEEACDENNIIQGVNNIPDDFEEKSANYPTCTNTPITKNRLFRSGVEVENDVFMEDIYAGLELDTEYAIKVKLTNESSLKVMGSQTMVLNCQSIFCLIFSPLFVLFW